ncbi:MAG: hypothetical protein ACYC2T_08380 [Bacillota bacterium]
MFLETMLAVVRRFVKDQRGALTTVELIGYTVLIGGAVVLIGYGITAMSRGKVGDALNAFQNIRIMDDAVDENSGYGYVAGSAVKDLDTGIITDVQGN